MPRSHRFRLALSHPARRAGSVGRWLVGMLAALGTVPAVSAAQRPTRVALVPASCPSVTTSSPTASPSPAVVSVPGPLRRAAAQLVWRKGPVEWTTWPVVVGTTRWSVDLVVARLDPTRVPLELAIRREGSALAPWRIDQAPSDVRIALNAGQFTDDGPWGWVVHRGREWQPAGVGALAAAFVIDSGGRARIIAAHEIAAAKARGGIREAVQSYPHMLADGVTPEALCEGTAVHPTHRDIRLAIGTMADGRVLIVLSRYAGLGRAGDRTPIGPTTREMAMVMATLGARDAVLLDGGLSAQLRLRDGGAAAGTFHDWPGLRGVPLALIGRDAAELAPLFSAR